MVLKFLKFIAEYQIPINQKNMARRLQDDVAKFLPGFISLNNILNTYSAPPSVLKIIIKARHKALLKKLVLQNDK